MLVVGNEGGGDGGDSTTGGGLACEMTGDESGEDRPAAWSGSDSN
jgi:hypothetical protein